MSHGDTIRERQHPLLELPRGLLALGRRTLGDERHRQAIALLDKLGTGPMAVEGINKQWTPCRSPRWYSW